MTSGRPAAPGSRSEPAYLLVVAGEWAGFDHEWLFTEATRRARGRSLMLRISLKLGIWRRIMTFATERDWKTLVGLLGVIGPKDR